MKKTLTTLLAAFCALGAMAQEDNITNKCVVSIYDFDGDFTNIRSAAGGAVVDKLPTGTEYRFCLVDGKNDVNGYLQIPDGKVYKYSDYEIDNPVSFYQKNLKGSSTGYWVHNSVLRIQSSKEGVVLYKEPSTSSMVNYEVSYSIKLRPLRQKGDFVYVKTVDGKYEGWAQKSKVCYNTLMCATEEPSYHYSVKYYDLNREFKVNGGVGIEQFVNALGLNGDYDWDTDPTWDKANGYFEFSQEGAGGVHYYGAYWNRTDGKKMFIFSFNMLEDFDNEFMQNQFELPNNIKTNEFFRVRTTKLDSDFQLVEQSGFVAYLYNPTSQKLEPMKTSPFANMPQTDDLFIYQLPQHGKDIKVMQYKINDRESASYHTLKFNGKTFDFVK